MSKKFTGDRDLAAVAHDAIRSRTISSNYLLALQTHKFTGDRDLAAVAHDAIRARTISSNYLLALRSEHRVGDGLFEMLRRRGRRISRIVFNYASTSSLSRDT